MFEGTLVKYVAAGSFETRLGLAEGTQLPCSIIEYYYENDALSDTDGVGGARLKGPKIIQ